MSFPIGRGTGGPDLSGAVRVGGNAFFLAGKLNEIQGGTPIFLIGLKSPPRQRVVTHKARYTLVTVGSRLKGAVLHIGPENWAVLSDKEIVAEGKVSVPEGTRGVFALTSAHDDTCMWAFTDPSGRLMIISDDPSRSCMLGIGFRQDSVR
jgi:hypothetical protein